MSKNLILACPAINSERINKVKENIMRWLGMPVLGELVTAFNNEMPLNLDEKGLSKWLLDFSECWNFRSRQKQAFDNKVCESARWLLNNDELTESQKSLALRAALELGLRDNAEPVDKDFDYIWVLGGARLSCLLRSRLAVQIIKNSCYFPKAVVLLTTMRPIGDGEREATNTYALDAKTEFDLFVAAAKLEFNLDDYYSEERYDDIENNNKSWILRKYISAHYDVYIIAAPSSDPEKRRANSADTYEFFFNNFQTSVGASILLATSQISVPYQHLEAVRTIALPHGIFLDTIGFPTEWGGTLQGMNEPSNYLQEIRSTIQAIDRFLSI